jgi:DNA repair protein RecO (recombination protein O)
MEWSDEGIILGVKPHGETAAIVEVFTRSHGRHAGLVHGGRSRKLRPILQTGNEIDVAWKARLQDQLGHFAVDLRRAHGVGVLDRPTALLAVTSMTTLARLLPERDPHPSLYEVTLFVLGFLDDETTWPALVVRWELALLEELGFGLDLGRCAATGANDRLIYVSPRTGRAVSESAGEPYRDKLLALPAFLAPRAAGARVDVDAAALRDGFVLTGHFLTERVLGPRGLTLPEARARLASALTRPSV